MDGHVEQQIDQLVAYIKQQLQAGIPANDVWQTLLNAKWQPDMVQRAFAQAQAPNTPPPLPGTPQQPSLVETPAKYKVFRAIADTVRAARRNLLNTGLALVIGYAISFAALYLASFLVAILFLSDLEVLFASSAQRLGMLLGSIALHVVISYVATIFAMTLLSLAIFDGSLQRNRPIGPLLKAALGRMKRIVPGTLLFDLLIGWPLLLLYLAPFVMLNSNSASTTVITIALFGIFAVIWVLFCYLRFALVPYVIIFEPNTPVMKSFGRSKRLLISNGGQWFLAKGLLLFIAVSIILSMVLGVSLPSIQETDSTAENVYFIVLMTIAQAVLVLFYRNRAMIAAKQDSRQGTTEQIVEQ